MTEPAPAAEPTVCDICSALVQNPELHLAWHVGPTIVPPEPPPAVEPIDPPTEWTPPGQTDSLTG